MTIKIYYLYLYHIFVNFYISMLGTNKNNLHNFLNNPLMDLTYNNNN